MTPARTLGTSPIERLVDAGYFDNYGIDLATSWLEQHRTWIEDNTSGVILIQIRAFSNERQLRRLPGTITEPTSSSNTDSGPATTSPGHLRRNDFQSVFRGLLENLTRGAEFLTTPFQTLERARSNINYYRNDAAIENLKRSFTFDMLQKLTGDLSSSEGAAKPSASDYSRANRFFRVFTFTCSNPRAELGDPSQTETLSWYLSESEFDYVLGNWDTIDNYRRHQYLQQTFRRYFSVDDPAGTTTTTTEGAPTTGENPSPNQIPMESGEILPLDDKVKSAATNIGNGYHLIANSKKREDSETRTFIWRFEGVPSGSYDVDVNLPRYQHAANKLPSGMMIAERFNYQIESRALMAGEEASEGEEANRGVIFPAVLELDKDHKNWRNAGASDLGDANPLLGRWSIKSRTDSSERRRLFDEIDQYAQLGLWYRLATIYEPPAPSDSERTGEKPRPRLMNITVTLEAPEKLGEAAIADAVRIRRRDGRSAR